MMPLFGKLFDAGGFSTAFLIAALFPVAGITAWLFLARPGTLKYATTCLD
jgi:hypothetical protein